MALYAVFANDFDAQIDHDLNTRLVDVTRLADAAARTSEDEPRRVPSASGDGLVQVYRADGRLLGSSRGIRGIRFLTPAQVRRAAGGRIRIARAHTPVGETRVEAGRAAVAPLVVAVGELAQAPRPRAGPAAPAAPDRVPAGAAACHLRRATRSPAPRCGPVERMRARAAQVTERDTSERLPVPETHDEIEALGRTLNDLLARLDSALGRERRLLSDASHELRTPLSVLRTEVELALRGERDAHELRAALESVGQEAERLSRLADDLLVLARADQGRLPIRPEPLDVPSCSGGGGPRRRRRTAGRLAADDGRRSLPWRTPTARPRRSTTWSPTRSAHGSGRRPAQRARPTAAACSCT